MQEGIPIIVASTETNTPKLAKAPELEREYPFYETVPDWEYNKQRFNYMENAEELMIQTHSFMEKIADFYKNDDKLDAIFFLDKSARPLAYMFKQLFREYVQDPEAKIPQILFFNVGQEITLPDDNSCPDEREIGFSGKTEPIQEAYGHWIKPNSHILVVDEYSSTGQSLSNATEMIRKAFTYKDAKVDSMAAFTKVPKWYHRPEFLGVRDRTGNDYVEFSYKRADRELDVSYASIRPDRFGRLSEDDVPREVQARRVNIFDKIYNFLEGSGNFPTASVMENSQIKKAREELKKMCAEIIQIHKNVNDPNPAD